MRVVAPGVSDNGLLYQATCHLYQNDFTPARESVLTDFTEADFSGYAAGSAITWSPGITDDDGISRIPANTQEFLATAATITNTIYGYYIVAADGTTLLFSERLAAPRLVNHIGDGVVLVPIFSNIDNVTALLMP